MEEGDGKVYTLILKDEKAAGKREDGREKAGMNWEVDFMVGRKEASGGAGIEGREKGEKESAVVDDDVGTTTTIWVPWEDFKATYRGKEKEDAGELKRGEVRKVGFMMRR